MLANIVTSLIEKVFDWLKKNFFIVKIDVCETGDDLLHTCDTILLSVYL